MPTTDAENFSFICDERPAKLWDKEVIIQNDFFTGLLINIIKMDIFGTPFKVMHKLSGAITLFEDESIV